MYPASCKGLVEYKGQINLEVGSDDAELDLH